MGILFLKIHEQNPVPKPLFSNLIDKIPRSLQEFALYSG